ncbi:MAG: radical SAM protein [Candidatus Aminicenantes bacterium]|nr:radical SAM protein [Candidatus Aminicenantes bacterium]
MGTPELKQLKLRYDLARFETRRWSFTVAVNHACNLACTYCYEVRDRAFMSPETADRFVVFAAANGGQCGFADVVWYGGEPLLSARLVISTSAKLKQTLAELGSGYASSIITNGTLLTGDLAEELLASGISSAQITIDGGRADHDRRRITSQGERTFDLILRALEAVPAGLRVSLRVNMDNENLPGLPEALRNIAGLRLRCPLVINFSPLLPYGEGCKTGAGSSLWTSWKPLREEGLHIAELLRASCSLGLAVRLPLRTDAVCAAVARQAVLVEPDGTLKKCWTDVGADTGTVGRIDQPLSLDNQELVDWLAYDPTAAVECHDCELLPMCMAGCPWSVRNGIGLPARCHPMKGVMTQVREIVEKLVSEGLAVFDPESGIVQGKPAKKRNRKP